MFSAQASARKGHGSQVQDFMSSGVGFQGFESKRNPGKVMARLQPEQCCHFEWFWAQGVVSAVQGFRLP